METTCVVTKIIQHYKFDNQCFAEFPNPGYRYFTVKGNIPMGGIPGEDCVRINNPQYLVIEDFGTRFRISDGGRSLYMAKSRAEAEKIIQIIHHYKARFTCYVERSGAGMTYLKR